VGPEAGLDALDKSKNYFSPFRESNPNRPVYSPSLYRLSYLGSTDFINFSNFLLFFLYCCFHINLISLSICLSTALQTVVLP
jgi:hypothetical protein